MALTDPRSEPSSNPFLRVAAQNRETLPYLPAASPRLLVIGNFNAGKSTLINALLGKRLLPAALKPTTGAVIRIVWGEEDRTTVRFKDGRMKTASGTALLAEYAVIGAVGNSERVEDIQLETGSPFLRDDLMVVDIPGMEDDPGRYAAIYREVMFADVVVSVHDVGVQMPWSEQTFLQEQLIANGCASICVVWNKCNLLEEEQQQQAVAGAVARLKGVDLRPLEPLRSWYRLDALPELRKRLAGESASASFQTFEEDVKEALKPDSLLRRQAGATRLVTLLAAERETESERSGSAQIIAWRTQACAVAERLLTTAAQGGMEAAQAHLTERAESLRENRGNLLIQVREVAAEAATILEYLEQSRATADRDRQQIQEDYRFVHGNFDEARRRQAGLSALIQGYREELQIGLQRSFYLRIQAILQYLPDPESLPEPLSPQAISQILNAHVQSPVEAWRQDKNGANSAYQTLRPPIARLSAEIHAEITRLLGLVTEISGVEPDRSIPETPEARRAVGRVVSSVSLRLIDQEALLVAFMARMPSVEAGGLAALRGANRSDLVPRAAILLKTTLVESGTQIEAALSAVLANIEKRILASTASALAAIENRWSEMMASDEKSSNADFAETAIAQTRSHLDTLEEIYYNFQAALTMFLPLRNQGDSVASSAGSSTLSVTPAAPWRDPA